MKCIISACSARDRLDRCFLIVCTLILIISLSLFVYSTNQIGLWVQKLEFLLLNVGWYKHYYRHTIVFHLQIRGDKIWVHEYNTLKNK
ncbi:MAG: element excision factor XisI family protein [Chitinophagales bacterium]